MSRYPGWKTLILVGFLAVVLAGIANAEPIADFGRAEKAWQYYLETSDSAGAAQQFERAVARREPSPLEALGQATLPDSWEEFDAAQQFYLETLRQVWKQLKSLDAQTARSLAAITLQPGQIPEGLEPQLNQAVWLWAIGNHALYSASRIAPYASSAEPFLHLLQSLSEDDAIPDWQGFHLLRAEIQQTLAAQWRERGDIPGAEELMGQMGWIRDFLWIGPFPNREKAGLAEVYPPEENFDPEGVYEGKVQPVSWRTLKPRPTWGYVDLNAIVEPPENSTTYAISFIYSHESRPAALDLGHAGALKVWVSGRLAYAADRYHAAHPFQGRALVQLEPGWNPILIKNCSHESRQYGFYIRLTEPSGRPFQSPHDEGSPVRIWKVEEPLPGFLARFPVKGEQPDSPNWIRETLSRLSTMEADPLPAALSKWLAASYFHYHRNLDETETLAIDLMRAAEKNYPRSSLIQRWIGETDRDANRSRQAYMRAAELDAREVNALSQLARHYQQQPYRDLMLESVERGLARNPNSPRLWLLKGEGLLRLGTAEALAQRAFDQAIALAPGYYYGYNRKADMRGNALSINRQIELQEKALSLNRAAQEVRQSLMENLLRAGRTERAIELAEEGVLFEPFESRWYAMLARYYRTVEDWVQADVMIERALQITPDNPALNRLAGEIHHAQGRQDAARISWETALRIRPNTPDLQEYVSLLFEDVDDYYQPYRIDLGDLPEVKAEDYPDARVVYLLDHQVEKVYPNGVSSRTTHLIRKALTDAGVNELKSHPIYFEPGRQRVRILRARVIRADGSVFDAPQPTVRQARGSAESRIYMDYSVQILSFPAVERGAIVDLEYQVDQTGENIFADYFGSMYFFNSYSPMLLSEYVLITPSERKFYSRVIQPDARFALPDFPTLAQLPDRIREGNFFYEREDRNERVWIWNFHNRSQIRQEPSMPSLSELASYVKVSTFQSWDDMARWYWDLIKDQFVPDEAVRRRTQELVSAYAERLGKPETALSDLEIVKALNSYVNTQIRYLGLEFGIQGYRPRRVVDILSSQYGDCKDKATILVTMAAEKGVPGRIALVRTSDLGEIDYELPSLGLFNHAIIYFPDLDGMPFVLDGTARFFGTTELPPADQGINLLTIIEGGAYEFVRSPIDTADKTRAEYLTTISLNPDGSAVARRDSRFRGLFNPSVRSTYENRGKVQELVEAQFGSAFPGTTASEIELSDLDDFEQDEWIRFRLDIPKFADQPAGQPDRLVFRPVLFPLEMSRSFGALPRREHEMVLRYNWSRFRKKEITLPAGYRVAQLPEAREIQSPFGSLKLSCRVEGNQIIFEQEVVLQVDTLRIPVSQYPEFRQFCVQVDRAEEQAIILEKIKS